MLIARFEGEKVSVTDLTLNGKTAIISLWATWCVPCIKELDAINELYDEWKEEVDFEVYAISVDDSRSIKRAKALVNGKGWEHKILLDTNQNLKRALGAAAIPETIIVDDILDIIATEDQLGKPAGNDLIEGVYTLSLIHI